MVKATKQDVDDWIKKTVDKWSGVDLECYRAKGEAWQKKLDVFNAAKKVKS